jgi:hypothetical protein
VSRDTTTLTVRGEQLGTLMYTAPELFSDFSQADNQSDIYTLGKILLQMLSSRPIFPVPSLTGLDGKYVYILQKCLQINPSDRYQSVRELENDFKLLTQTKYDIESPSQISQRIISEAVDPLTEIADSSSIDELVKVFCENTDDKELFVETIPRLPREIIKKIIDKNILTFITIFQVYDNFINGNLVFEYCDLVADFYYQVYTLTDDFNIHRLIISRLLSVGVNHNRWHVRDILALILENIKDAGMAKAALEVCRGNNNGTQWSSAAFNMGKLHPLLKEGIREILKPIEEDEIPF